LVPFVLFYFFAARKTGEDASPVSQFDALAGISTAIGIVGGVVNPSGLDQLFDGRRRRLAFFNDFINIYGLIAELPEMMLGVVLIAISEKLE
jgi:hypothetical protein